MRYILPVMIESGKPFPLVLWLSQHTNYQNAQIWYYVFLCKIKQFKDTFSLAIPHFSLFFFLSVAKISAVVAFLFIQQTSFYTYFTLVFSYEFWGISQTIRSHPSPIPTTFTVTVSELLCTQLIFPFILVSFSFCFRDYNFLTLFTKWEP